MRDWPAGPPGRRRAHAVVLTTTGCVGVRTRSWRFRQPFSTPTFTSWPMSCPSTTSLSSVAPSPALTATARCVKRPVSLWGFKAYPEIACMAFFRSGGGLPCRVQQVRRVAERLRCSNGAWGRARASLAQLAHPTHSIRRVSLVARRHGKRRSGARALRTRCTTSTPRTSSIKTFTPTLVRLPPVARRARTNDGLTFVGGSPRGAFWQSGSTKPSSRRSGIFTGSARPKAAGPGRHGAIGHEKHEKTPLSYIVQRPSCLFFDAECTQSSESWGGRRAGEGGRERRRERVG